jgi:CHAT domain-containing protein
VLVDFRIVDDSSDQQSWANIFLPNGKYVIAEMMGFTAQALARLLKLPISAYKNLMMAVRSFDGEIAQREACKLWRDSVTNALSSLYQQLVCTVRNKIRDNLPGYDPEDPPVIVFALDRALHLLPLHACWWINGKGTIQYLLDEFPIAYTTSWSLFIKSFERRSGMDVTRDLLGIINPNPPGNLCFSEWAVDEITRNVICPSHVLRGDEPTREAVLALLSSLPGPHLLHLDCHGQYDSASPLDSSLMLADEEALTIEDILYRVRVTDNWLVVLSACETAAGPVGDGLIDGTEYDSILVYLVDQLRFTSAFQLVGASTVYGNLWMVRDLPTALLLKKAYAGLVAGKSKPVALREAQNWLRTIRANEVLKELKVIAQDLERKGILPEAISNACRYFEWIPGENRPYEDICYWGGFHCMGL